MATNLLLEGDDLEALLIKAHSQGGPNARIVRADKFRHGGVWGFFARERFEVAVEIPEPATAPASPVPASPEALIGHRHLQPGGRRARRSDQVEPAVPLPPPARPAGWSSPDAAAGYMTPAVGELPTPAELAVGGLLGIADRVDAAERAASRAVRAMLDEPVPGATATATGATATGGPAPTGLGGRSGGGGQPRTERPGSSITLPGADQVRAYASTMTMTRPTNGTVSSDMKHPARTPDRSPAQPEGRRVPAALDAIVAMAAAELSDVPHEPGLSPVRPSTSRPEFTALLDQLREGARPPRQRSPKPPEQPRPHPGDTRDAGPGGPAASLPDDLSLRFDGPLVELGVELGVEPPIERAAPVPALAPIPAPPAQPAPPVPAPVEAPTLAPTTSATTTSAPTLAPTTSGTTTSGAEQDEDDDPRANRQGDPRTAADRRTLRALGVPAAWTRRLRSGDRFAEVLRMLERMPDSDIDPDAKVVAVVGPAAVVRLEAHRTAVDLGTASGPRPVVVVPATVGTERATAVARALRSGPVVLAVESAGDDAGVVLDTLTTVQAGAVIAVVDAAAPLEATQRWLDALGQVDALVLDGATTVSDPAAVLQLGLPVVRLDGVPVDRVTWTALLCAQLLAAQARQGR